MIHDLAARRAVKLSTVELVGLLRGLIGSRRHPPGVSWREGSPTTSSTPRTS
jgi:hypothetical protein